MTVQLSTAAAAPSVAAAGVPAPAMPAVPFAVTEITAAAQDAALRVLRSGWITAGQETVTFERELADYVGARYAVAVSSCTAAIELSLRALRLTPGAVVLTPSLTFCGAVAAILHAGLRPVLVDVDEVTGVITPETVAAAVRRTGRVAALVVQHHAGYPVEVRPLADAAGLPAHRVVEDAAHGLGASTDAGMVGGASYAGCLSFYATKNLPIGEGGAVTSDDHELIEWVRCARLHGMSRDAWRRYLPGGSWRYDVPELGFKANFTDLQAAIGRAQLHELPAWQRRRAELAGRYDLLLADLPGLRVPARPEHGGHAWHLYQVRVGAGSGLTRDELSAALAAAGIGTSVHFIPVHQLTGFAARIDVADRSDLDVTDRIAAELLSLPMHPRLTDEDVQVVADAISRDVRVTASSTPRRPPC